MSRYLNEYDWRAPVKLTAGILAFVLIAQLSVGLEHGLPDFDSFYSAIMAISTWTVMLAAVIRMFWSAYSPTFLLECYMATWGYKLPGLLAFVNTGRLLKTLAVGIILSVMIVLLTELVIDFIKAKCLEKD